MENYATTARSPHLKRNKDSRRLLSDNPPTVARLRQVQMFTTLHHAAAGLETLTITTRTAPLLLQAPQEKCRRMTDLRHASWPPQPQHVTSNT